MNWRWHKYVRRHPQEWNRVTVPMFDPSAKGYMVYCCCGKHWAL